MDYKIIRSALTAEQCESFSAKGDKQYLLTKADQKIGVRGYPGFTMTNVSEELLVLGELAKQLNIEFDYNIGTAINYINAVKGEEVGPHFDKPLYDPVDVMKNKMDKYNGRFCAVSVLVFLNDEYTGGTVTVEGDDIVLNKGDAVVIKGYTLHQLTPIESGKLKMASAFFCNTSLQ